MSCAFSGNNMKNYHLFFFLCTKAGQHAGQKSADGILKYCSYFFQETGFDISCKLSGDNLHATSSPTFWENKKKKNIHNWSSAQLAQTAVMVKSLIKFM